MILHTDIVITVYMPFWQRAHENDIFYNGSLFFHLLFVVDCIIFFIAAAFFGFITPIISL